MADNDDAPQEETVEQVLTGEPKDPDSPLHGASFQSASDGMASRELPKAKPKADKKPDDDQKPENGKPEKSADKENDKDKPDKKPAKKPERADRDNIGGREGAKQHMVMSQAGDEPDDAKNIALFDFDGTLVEQDTLDLFIGAVCGGKWRGRLRMLPAFFTAFTEAVLTTDDYMDYRSALKAHWIINALKGVSTDRALEAAEQVAKQVNWRTKLVADLKRFAEQGTDVVIATGALDIYIKRVIQDLPVTALICTHAEVKDGKLTGRMAGEVKSQCNVVRGEKRFRTQAYIKEHGPYWRVIGYGNLPSDGPMLSLCDEFYIV